MSNGTKLLPKFTWHRNPDLDSTMTFEDDPFMVFETDEWNDAYEHVWYIDPRFNPTDEKIWAIKRIPTGENLGVKEGFLIPDLNIEFNPSLPDLNVDLNQCCPAYWELAHECAWELDPIHTEKRMWVVKFSPKYRKPKDWKWYGVVSPDYNVEYNPALPPMQSEIDYVIPWHDLEYEHVWYLEGKEKIWVAKLKVVDNPIGIKDMGTVELDIPRLDVIFISYNEPNAEENWQRLLEKAPWAKRVNGVKGIFEAHKAAAKLSSTDMFYVVDADAYLIDEWNFDFEPYIFDRDCAYVWNSRNPLNDLVYGYGGVKLFPKALLLKKRKWQTLDMFTGISKKIKVMDTVSNETRFNTDEFSTWRSAFRECVKLYSNNQLSNLNAWLDINKDKPFGKYAILGANAGYQYAKDNDGNYTELTNINNYEWLREQFNLNNE
jgi:hypothetical protein